MLNFNGLGTSYLAYGGNSGLRKYYNVSITRFGTILWGRLVTTTDQAQN